MSLVFVVVEMVKFRCVVGVPAVYEVVPSMVTVPQEHQVEFVEPNPILLMAFVPFWAVTTFTSSIIVIVPQTVV